MRIAYLECFSGISGDMFLGALVDAGVSPDLLRQTITSLGVDAKLEISRANRSGISSVKVDVLAAGEKELPREEFFEKEDHAAGHSHHQAEEHRHTHPHTHEHDHGHTHEHEHEHSHAHDHHHEHEQSHAHSHTHEHSHRGLKEIREIINRATISATAKQRAIAIFEALGAAEARVHNVDIEKIHFHEVGAIDAIVDITCAAVGAEALGVDEWVCSPLNVGGGMVKCAHGTFPVPAPATLDLLQNAPVYSGEIQKELVTPTGAAIVRVLVNRYGTFPRMKAQKIGYGAGTRDFKDHLNVVRLTIGETDQEAELPFPLETVSILEANLDDMSPQVFGYVMERAMEQGALDVYGTPVQMKKSRPGIVLTLLCRPEDEARLAKLVFSETTTLGIRMRKESRATLARRHVVVQTKWGEVRMKLARLNGSISNYAPEYEDCRRIAAEHHVPLKSVLQETIRMYLESEHG